MLFRSVSQSRYSTTLHLHIHNIHNNQTIREHLTTTTTTTQQHAHKSTTTTNNITNIKHTHKHQPHTLRAAHNNNTLHTKLKAQHVRTLQHNATNNTIPNNNIEHHLPHAQPQTPHQNTEHHELTLTTSTIPHAPQLTKTIINNSTLHPIVTGKQIGRAHV